MNARTGKIDSCGNRFYFCTVIVAAVIALVTAQFPAWAKDRLTIGITNSASDTPMFIAEKRGFFSDEGIEPEFVQFASATQMIAPLSGGDLSVGAGAPGAGLYNATKREIALRIVADKGSMPKNHGYLSLLVRKDLVDSGKVKSLADLKGLKIGDLSKQGSGDITLNEILKKGGLKFTDVEPLYMGAPQLAIALENKALDATLITEPNLSLLVNRGTAVLFQRSDETYPNQQLAVILFSEALVKKNKDLAQRFMNAYVRALHVYNDAIQEGHLTGPGADEIVDLLIEKTNFKDRAMYRKIIAPGLNPNCHVNKAGLKSDFAFYSEMGWVDRTQDPDSIVDDSFCANAVAKVGQYGRAKK